MGEIKFYHKENIYKIFYGSDLSHVYDYLSLLQLIYKRFDKEFNSCCRRSPLEELIYFLKIQDEIISGIKIQPKIKELPEISPGYLEIPSLEYWNETSKFYNNYNLTVQCAPNFLKNYTIEIGSQSGEHLLNEKFGEMLSLGEFFPYSFVLYNEHYYPILPRLYN